MTAGERPAAADTSRDQVIESIRGLSIVLLVTYHSVGSKQQAHGPLAWVFEFIHPIIIPLFAVLAGYVYAMRPAATWGDIPEITRSKFRRVLTPFLIATATTFISKGLVEGHVAWGEIWRPLLFSYDHFWFLQSLFVVFLIAAFFGALDLFCGARRWAFLTLALWAICPLLPGTDFFSLWGVNYLLPMFAVGYGCCRFNALVMSHHALLGWAVTGVAMLSLLALAKIDVLSIPEARTDIAPMLLGVTLSIALLASKLQGRGIAWLGRMSYCIYLYHGFGISLAMKLLGVAGIGDGGYGAFTAKVATGLLCPVALALALSRIKPLRRLVLG